MEPISERKLWRKLYNLAILFSKGDNIEQMTIIMAFFYASLLIPATFTDSFKNTKIGVLAGICSFAFIWLGVILGFIIGVLFITDTYDKAFIMIPREVEDEGYRLVDEGEYVRLTLNKVEVEF